MLRITIPLLLALAAPALTAGDDPFAGDLRDLASPFAGTRLEAIARLARAEGDVEPRLLDAYRDGDFHVRAGVLDVLAERESACALALVLEDLGNTSRTVREAQARYLARLGDPARDALTEIARGPDENRAKQARERLVLVVRVRVERAILEKTLGKGLHYEGQYAHLLPDRDRAAPVLLEMVGNAGGGYRFQVPLTHVVDAFEIRGLAADALADIGRPVDAEALLEIHAAVAEAGEQEEDWRRALRLDGLLQAIGYALWDLGEKVPTERFAQDQYDLLEAIRDPYGTGRSIVPNRARYQLAQTYSRMRRYGQAAKLYRDLLRFPDSDGVYPSLCYYNLACALSLDGRPDEALSALRDAVRIDAFALDMAMEDGDLRGLRETFPDLRERLAKFAPSREAPLEVPDGVGIPR